MSFDTARIRADNPLSAFIGKVLPLKQDGHEYKTCCPFHKEKSASFTVSDEKGFYHCFGCGAHGDVIGFVEDYYNVKFTEACEILGGKREAPVGNNASEGATVEEKSETDAYVGLVPVYPLPEIKPNEPVRFWNPKRDKFSRFVPSMVFPYKNMDGTVHGYVLRVEIEGNKITPTLRWVRKPDGETCWSMMPFDKPRKLYGLERLTTDIEKQVFVVEGEKCADVANTFLGIRTIAWSGGANGIAHVDWTPASGMRFALICDADQEGENAMVGFYKDTQAKGKKYIKGVADYLHEAGAKEVKIVPWDREKEKGWDIADAVKEGMTREQYLEWLKARVKKWEPRPAPAKIEEPKVADIVGKDGNEDKANGFTTVLDQAPFRCLGFDRDRYYYLSREMQIIRALSGPQHTKNALFELAPIQWWEHAFPQKNSGFNVDNAVNAMMSANRRVGFFNPDSIRGRGAWWDAGRIVVHLGNRTVIGDEVYKPAETPSKFVYEQGFPLDADLSSPLGTKEAHELLKLCQMLPFDKPIYSMYLAGWIVVAHIGGALKWRPHIWITGSLKSGKTHTISQIVKPMLGENCLFVQSASSEAGIRQMLETDSLPVLFDEAEGETQHDHMRMQGVLRLARQSSSETGGIIAKGTTSGEALTFNIRSCFCMSSINANIVQQSDKSRITVLEMSASKIRHPIQELEAIEARICKNEDWVRRFHARAVHLAPVIRKNVAMFTQAVAAVFKDQRAGEQLGTMLAGAYSLHSKAEISYDKAVEWVQQQDWKEQQEEVAATSDQKMLINHLYSQRVQVKLGREGTDTMTIGELIDIAGGLRPTENISYIKANEIICRYGFKVQGQRVYISNTADPIKRALRETAWSTEWHRILMRIEGAQKAGTTYFGYSGSEARAVSIPLHEQTVTLLPPEPMRPGHGASSATSAPPDDLLDDGDLYERL